MEEEKQETVFCGNCKKDIPSSNFRMHEPHCLRNIFLCSKCGEPVSKTQEEEHNEENHVEVKCECGETMEKMHLDEHKENYCTSRKTVCEYCELELTVGKIDSHKDYCGSRTELCEKCNKRILHRDLEEHLKNDCQLDEPYASNNNTSSSTAQNGFSRTPPEEIVRNFGFGDVANLGGLGAEVFHRLITTGYGTLPVGDSFEQDDYLENENVYPFHTGRRDNVVARGPPNNSLPRQQPRRERIPHFVDNQVVEDGDGFVRQDHLEDDELMAALLSCDEGVGGFKNPLLGIIPPYPGINHEGDYAPDLDETVLPCEFCGELINAQDLIQHQTGCQLTSSGSPSHYRSLRSQLRTLPPLEPESQIVDDYEEHGEDIEPRDETFLPCEFCQELIPSDSLIGHQSICDPETSRPPSAIQTIHGLFFESQHLPPNNSSQPHTRSRPPRPSRPVVVDDSDELNGNFSDPTSDSFSSRKINSNGNMNNRNSSDLASDDYSTRRNNDLGPSVRRSASNSVPLTIRNKQPPQSSSKKRSIKKPITTSQRQTEDLIRPLRATEDDKNENYEVALPTRTSKMLNSSSYSNGTYSNAMRNKRTEDDLFWEMRPLQETGSTQSSSDNQRRPRRGAGSSSSGSPFQHTAETRKQMHRLAPSISKPTVKADNSRKEGTKNKKVVLSERREQGTSQMAAQGTSGSGKPKSKSKTRKKIV